MRRCQQCGVGEPAELAHSATIGLQGELRLDLQLGVDKVDFPAYQKPIEHIWNAESR